ncbi:hypothetical protein FE257_001816 [Aspergillus nanangensis]|uniref:Uncharacterized protein n=1 Tax=Aspergillus nanangensis TaxID=2582783 RepID=A0AAD4CDE0_ASPNN|nr:hypothetical protein FE257_001816 [Aspergillus nanangensis]
MTRHSSHVSGHHGRGWRPMTLGPRYLLPLACLMLTMLVITEAMRLWSIRHGGLAFYSSDEDITDGRVFAFTYVPTICGLVVTILWSFAEYDALRLEPYFQLSKPEGVRADVLFINYVFGRFVSTPFIAIRNRHWLVVLVSMLTVSLQLLLPTVQSSLLRLDDSTAVFKESIKMWPDFIDLTTQDTLVYGSNTGGDLLVYDWVRSDTYAMAPVGIALDDKYETKMWKLNQSVYWAEVSCEDVHVVDAVNITSSDTDEPYAGDHSMQLNMSSVSSTKDRCSLEINDHIVIPSSTTHQQILQWQPKTKISNRTSQCTSFDLFAVVVDIRMSGIPFRPEISSQVSGFGCKMLYKNAMAKVDLNANGSLSHLDLDKGSIKQISNTSIDTTQFKETILREAEFTSGLTFIHGESKSLKQTGRDFVDDIDFIVKKSFVPLMSRVFDVGGRTVLADGYRLAFQTALIVDPTHSMISEAILIFGIVIVLFLLWFYPRRPNMLYGNPTSIASMCTIINDIIDDTELLKLNLSELSTRQSRSLLRNSWCVWRRRENGQAYIRIETLDASIVPHAQSLKPRRDVMPHFLVIPVFLLEALGFVAVMVAIGVLFAFSRETGELTQVTSDNLASLFTIVPSGVASIIRALCISVYNNLSVLEPWFVLQSGRASASASLLLNYGSRSPFATAIQCFQGRHFILGLMAVVCFLNVGLSLVASGLFDQDYVTVSKSTQLMSYWDHKFFAISEDSYLLSELDLIQSSIYSGTSPLPWTSPDYTFLPAHATLIQDQTAIGSLLGIGAKLKCQQLPLEGHYMQDPGSHTAYWKYSPPGDPTAVCRLNSTAMASKHAQHRLSVNFVTSGKTNQTECQQPTTLVVAHINRGSHSGLSTDNTVALQCQPHINIQNFTVEFDAQGMVEYYSPKDATGITRGPMFENATINLAKYNQELSNPQGTFSSAPNITHNSTHHYHDWFGILTSRLYQTLDTNPDSIDPRLLSHAAQTVYQIFFATDLSVQRDFYFQYMDSPAPISDGKIYRWTWSIEPSFPSMLVALMIVVFDACVLAVVFATRRNRSRMPRMPMTIGSIIPWVRGSRMIKDLAGTYTWRDEDRSEWLERLNKRYRFGKEEQSGRYLLDEDWVDPHESRENYALSTYSAGIRMDPCSER